jgi:hypothetical protein
MHACMRHQLIMCRAGQPIARCESVARQSSWWRTNVAIGTRTTSTQFICLNFRVCASSLRLAEAHKYQARDTHADTGHSILMTSRFAARVDGVGQRAAVSAARIACWCVT